MVWSLRTGGIRPDGVFSTLFCDNALFCQTLEHAFEDADGNYYPKVKRGATYKCKRGRHRLDHYNKGEPFWTFEITGVVGHSGILFHPGNFNRNSDGCVLTGEKLHTESNEWWIDNSGLAFGQLMAQLDNVDEFDLEVL